MATKTLLFIDTNIFLDFYRTQGEAGISLLKHVESVTGILLLTDQVEMEFMNNRQRVIMEALGNVKPPEIPDFMPSYLADSKTAAALDKDIARVKKRIRVIKERFARILEHPNRHDPVFKSFRRIVDNSFRNFNLGNPEKKKQIIDFARERHERGFPPRKPDSTSLGDAINWEWILDSATGLSSNALIVSRDGDFGLSRKSGCYLNDWLSQEFKIRVSPKRKAELLHSLSPALKRLNVKVTAAEENEEKQIIKQSPPLAQLASAYYSGPSFGGWTSDKLLRLRGQSIERVLPLSGQTIQALQFAGIHTFADLMGSPVNILEDAGFSKASIQEIQDALFRMFELKLPEKLITKSRSFPLPPED